MRGYVLFITFSSTQEAANRPATDGLSIVGVDSVPASAVTWLGDSPGATATRAGEKGHIGTPEGQVAEDTPR